MTRRPHGPGPANSWWPGRENERADEVMDVDFNPEGRCMSDEPLTDEPEAAITEDVKEPSPARGVTRREAVLVGVLLLTVALWGYDRYTQWTLHADAAPLADALLRENTSGEVEAVTKLTVSREVPVFGTPHAIVEVFIRKAGEGASAPISGIEYSYALEEGKWTLKESGGCTSESCSVRGREAFETK